MGFSRQESLSGLSFPFPVDHILLGPNQQGHALQLLSVAGWHPGALTVPLLVLIEHLNLHWLSGSVNTQPGVEAKAMLEWLGRGSGEGWN